jgi:hypothetical protein
VAKVYALAPALTVCTKPYFKKTSKVSFGPDLPPFFQVLAAGCSPPPSTMSIDSAESKRRARIERSGLRGAGGED